MTSIVTLKKIMSYLSKKKDGGAKSTIAHSISSTYISVKEALVFLMQLEVVEKVEFDKKEYYKLREFWKVRLRFNGKGKYIQMDSHLLKWKNRID